MFILSCNRSPEPDKMKTSGADSGRAWLILIGFSILTLLSSGLRKGMSILLPTLTDQFEAKTWLIGTLIASMHAMRDFSAPIAGVLASRTDNRILCIFGGTMANLSVICASYAVNVEMLFMFFSVLNGFSLAMIGVPAYSLLAKSFDKYYPLASGIVQASGSFGIIIFAPLTTLLLDTYGWRNTLLLFGGIYLHLIVSGSLFQTPANTNMYASLRTNDVNISDHCLEASKLEKEALRCIDRAAPNSGKTSVWCHKFTHISGLSHFKNVSFIANCIALGCVNFTFTGWIIYLVPHCLVKGLSPTEASFLASIAGLAQLTGCLGYIPLLSKQIISAHSYIYASCLVGSIALFLDTFSSTFTTILLSNACFAFSVGALHPLLDVLLKSVVDRDTLPTAFGWRIAISGVFRILSGFVIGLLFDKNGSYDAGFYVLSALHAVCGMVLAVDHMRQIYKNDTKE